MTTADAQKVAAVLATVDDACLTCVSSATRQMQRALPDFDWAQLVAVAADCHWTADSIRSED